MKEIGELLKSTREKNGVTVEEASTDLGLKVSQINSIESGELRAFKDVCNLKFVVRDYAKYLGLDSDDIIDTFNEFIFDYTSRIPVEQIDKLKNEKRKEPKKIASPYTTTKKSKLDIPSIVVYIIIGLIILVIGYLVVGLAIESDLSNDNVIRLGDEQYELSK